MKHPDGIWHDFQPSWPAYFISELTGERIYFGEFHCAPVRRWRKRAVSVRPVKKVRPRRRIKRKVRTATITMEGISRETASLFLGVSYPDALEEGDEFRITIDGNELSAAACVAIGADAEAVQ